MPRHLAVIPTIAVLLIAVHACTGVVPLASGYYPAILDTGEVQIVDARELNRAQVENVLDGHHVIGRFDVRIPDDENAEQRLQEQLEKGTKRALDSGGNVLLFTDNSELIAVIRRDARYAGAPGAITMYVMLRR